MIYEVLKKLHFKGPLNNVDGWIALRNTDLYRNNILCVSVSLSLCSLACIHPQDYGLPQRCQSSWQSILANLFLQQAYLSGIERMLPSTYFNSVSPRSQAWWNKVRFIALSCKNFFQIISNPFCYSCTADWHKIRLLRLSQFFSVSLAQLLSAKKLINK